MLDHVENIFDRACELSRPERDEFLAEACGDNNPLRDQVEALLVADQKTSPILDDNTKLKLVDIPEIPKPGDAIGRYELIKKIGEGGMGVVFLAKQELPVSRQVAVKIIQSRQSSSADVIRRFESERQVLAMFDHPNVTKVFDGGLTKDGLPYFVMEYFGGEPITSFCQKYGLTLRSRLKLFVEACSALEHAHQKGVIHRDVKPSNILVASSEGRTQVRVIDFGIAKALTNVENLFSKSGTQVGTFVGTPEYMSPEQARMDSTPVDVRSDVFSLGVLLYEMVTGTVPLHGKIEHGQSPLKTLELVRDVDAEAVSSRVSKLPLTETHPVEAMDISLASYTRSLRGEMDWIVIKALENDPNDRYDSVKAFREDIVSFLNGDPVSVAAPSRTYRLKKLVMKHFVASLAISLAVLSLVASTIFSTYQSFNVHRAKEKSEVLAKQLQSKSDRLVKALVRANEGDRLKQTILYRKKTESALNRAMSRFFQSQFVDLMRNGGEEQDFGMNLISMGPGTAITMSLPPGGDIADDFSGPDPSRFPFEMMIGRPGMPEELRAIFGLPEQDAEYPRQDDSPAEIGALGAADLDLFSGPAETVSESVFGPVFGIGIDCLVPNPHVQNDAVPLLPRELLNDLRTFCSSANEFPGKQLFEAAMAKQFQLIGEEFEKEFGPFERVVSNAKILRAQVLMEEGQFEEALKLTRFQLEEFCAPRATDKRQFICRLIIRRCEAELGFPVTISVADLKDEFESLKTSVAERNQIRGAFPELEG